MADNTTLNPGAGGDVYASDDIGSVKFQRVKLVHGVDGTNDGDAANTSPYPTKSTSATRADTYTTAASGTAVDLAGSAAVTRPVSTFAMHAKGTGAVPTAFNVVLEVSLDGTNFYTILTLTQTTVDANGNAYAATGAQRFPGLQFRSRLVSITLGSASDLVVTIVGME